MKRVGFVAVTIAFSLLLSVFVVGWYLGSHSVSGLVIETERCDEPKPDAEGPKYMPTEVINLNTAEAKDLQLLPGVGPATAEAIIAYREEHGEFETIEEIMEVSGIGEKKFEEFKIWITVR